MSAIVRARIVLSNMSIAVIAGLGNPGQKYRNTRHNIGFDVVDRIAREAAVAWKQESRFEAETAEVAFRDRRLLLLKPQTYMNASGRSLSAVMRYHKLKPDQLLIIYDDITLDLGRPKLTCSGSAGGHNGIADLVSRIGSGFPRYRIGVGAKPCKEMDLADYVLSQFSAEERLFLDSRLPLYYEHVALIVDKGSEPAMNIINQRPSS